MSAPPLDQTRHISDGASFYVSLKPTKPETQVLIEKNGSTSPTAETLPVTGEGIAPISPAAEALPVTGEGIPEELVNFAQIHIP
jgi:hypothetical protein